MPKRISYPARIRPGSDTYYIRVGNSRPVSSGTTDYEEACELQARETARHFRRVKLGEKPAKSWQQAVIRWCQEKQHKVTLDQSDKPRLKWLEPFLIGIQDLNHIDRDMMHTIMSENFDGLDVANACSRNTTANKYVSLVAWILTAASREWGWGNIVPKFRTYPEPKLEPRWLTVEEWRMLIQVLPSHTRRVALFSLCTGVREAKAYGLRWSEVDLKNRSFTVSGTGNKNGVLAPLNSTAMSVLMECKSLPVVSPEYVFLWDGHRQPRHSPTTWKNHCAKAGIPYIKWHGLRATFITWLAQAGVPRDVRKRLAGHREGEAHDAYLGWSIETLRPYSEAIDRVLAGTISNTSATRNRLDSATS